MHDDWNQGRPTYNPPGQTLTVDDLTLHRPEATRHFSAFDYVRESWELMRANLLETIGGLLLAYGLVMGVQMLLTGFMYVVVLGGVMGGAVMGEANETLGAVVMGGGMLVGYGAMFTAMIVVQALGYAAYQLFWLRLVRGQTMTFGDLKAIKPLIVPLLGVTVLTSLASTAGSFALIIPGIILALGFGLSTWIVLDKNLGTLDAMKASWRLMQGHKMELLVLALVLGALNFGGMLACGMGMLLTLPLSAGALAIFYDRLVDPGNAYMHTR